MLWQVSIRKRFADPVKLWCLALVSIGSLSIQPCWADDNATDVQSLRQKQQLQASIARIKAQQALEAQQSSSQTGNAIARRNQEVQWQIQDLHNRNQDTLVQMRRAGNYVYDRNGSAYWVPAYTPEQISDTSRRMQDQEQAYQMTDHGQVQMAESHLHRSNELDTAATNLESQLETDRSNHGFKLSPVGTNLYVRNYQVGGSGGDDQDDESSPVRRPSGSLGSPLALPNQRTPGGSRSSPAPLAAQPGRLSHGNQKPTAGITDRSVAGKSGRVVQTSVTGQYLKP